MRGTSLLGLSDPKFTIADDESHEPGLSGELLLSMEGLELVKPQMGEAWQKRATNA